LAFRVLDMQFFLDMRPGETSSLNRNFAPSIDFNWGAIGKDYLPFSIHFWEVARVEIL